MSIHISAVQLGVPSAPVVSDTVRPHLRLVYHLRPVCAGAAVHWACCGPSSRPGLEQPCHGGWKHLSVRVWRRAADVATGQGRRSHGPTGPDPSDTPCPAPEAATAGRRRWWGSRRPAGCRSSIRGSVSDTTIAAAVTERRSWAARRGTTYGWRHHRSAPHRPLLAAPTQRHTRHRRLAPHINPAPSGTAARMPPSRPPSTVAAAALAQKAGRRSHSVPPKQGPP